MEIRQVSIPEAVRGEANGVATALTTLAKLLLFALGATAVSQSFDHLHREAWLWDTPTLAYR